MIICSSIDVEELEKALLWISWERFRYSYNRDLAKYTCRLCGKTGIQAGSDAQRHSRSHLMVFGISEEAAQLITRGK